MGGAFKPQGTESDRTATADYFSQLLSQSLQGKIDLPGVIQSAFTLPQYQGPLGAGVTPGQSQALGGMSQVLANYFGGNYNLGRTGGSQLPWGMPTPAGGLPNPQQPVPGSPTGPRFFPGGPGITPPGGNGGSSFYPPGFPQTGIPVGSYPGGPTNYPLPQPNPGSGPVLGMPNVSSGMLSAIAQAFGGGGGGATPGRTPAQQLWLTQPAGQDALDAAGGNVNGLDFSNFMASLGVGANDGTGGINSGLPPVNPAPGTFGNTPGGWNYQPDRIPNTSGIPVAGNPNPSDGQFGMNPAFIRPAPDRTFNPGAYSGAGGSAGIPQLGSDVGGGPGLSIPPAGYDILNMFQQAAGNGPYQLPGIQQAFEAQRQDQLRNNQRDLREQFSATGNRFSTNLIDALSRQQTESMNNQNATLAGLVPTLTGQSLQALLSAPQALTDISQLPYKLGGQAQSLAGGDLGLLSSIFGAQDQARTTEDTLAGRGYQEYQRTQQLLPQLLAFLSGAPAPEYTASPFTQGVNTATGVGSLALGAKALK